LKVIFAEFVTSAAAGGTTQGIPRDGLPQIAMAGRSNVGKSTLINALCRKKIARTSAAPGKTRLANIYRIELEGAGGPGRFTLYFVDLPGYGYARGGADSAQELAAVAEAYFTGSSVPLQADTTGTGSVRLPRPEHSRGQRDWPAGAPLASRRAALLLVDSRHPGLESDIQAAEWLDTMAVERHIVATKIDKLSRSERTRNLKAIGDTFGTAALPVSAERGEGLDELWRTIVRIGRSAGTRG
jgi:GTP-binding protein